MTVTCIALPACPVMEAWLRVCGTGCPKEKPHGAPLDSTDAGLTGKPMDSAISDGIMKRPNSHEYMSPEP